MRLVGSVLALLLLGASPAAAEGEISEADLERLFPAARSALVASGLDPAPLEFVTLEVADLEGERIGEAHGVFVRLDPDAAGVGWFVDPTPWSAEEFGPVRFGVARARAGSALGVDLWSTLVHELGHVIGLGHADGGFMTATLVRGQRRMPLAPRPGAVAPS